MTVSCRLLNRCAGQLKFPTRRTVSKFREDENQHSEPVVVTSENQYDHLADTVTPFWKTDYKWQLLNKQKFTKDIFVKFKQKLSYNVKTKIHRIIPSPITEGYRNKDEFSIRTGVDGNPKTVGFFIGKPINGQCLCVPPTHLINLKKNHIQIAQVYQEFIRSSPLSACHDLHDGGYWRSLIVRSNRLGETLAAVVVHPGGASQDEIDESKERLSSYFQNSGCNLKALYHQTCSHTRCTNSVSPFTLLYGEPFLYEVLGGYRFRVSPDSFFQVNVPAAELMYNAALGLANLSNKSTLLDLCCGTGAVSILASGLVRGCVGIEIVPEAVKDAVVNASNNSITNCNFICGRIERKLLGVLQDLEIASDIVVVLNPGRAGIDRATVKAIRKCRSISRIVYISCKADNKTTMQNFIDLCNPKFDKFPHYYLTNIQPVDMFPHTNHCELVLLFER